LHTTVRFRRNERIGVPFCVPETAGNPRVFGRFGGGIDPARVMTVRPLRFAARVNPTDTPINEAGIAG
jgi:hypothetical protein